MSPAIKTLMSWLLALLVMGILFWFLYSPEGGFSKVKQAASGIQSFAKISIGARQEAGETPTLPPVAAASVNSLRTGIRALQGKSNCFQKYTSLPVLEKVSITLKYNSERQSTTLVVKGGREGLQELPYDPLRDEFVGLRPCVIAGTGADTTGSIARNFHDTFLSGGLKTPYFLPVDRITFTGDGDENTLVVEWGGEGKKSSETFSDFNDGGWLFTPNDDIVAGGKEYVCFFPSGGSGLEKNILVGKDQGTIFSRMEREYALNKCVPEEGRLRYASLEFLMDPPYPNPHLLVEQVCHGLMGTDCPGTPFNERFSCDAEFKEMVSELPSEGCLIFATVHQDVGKPPIRCGWGIAEEGQVLLPASQQGEVGAPLQLLPDAVPPYDGAFDGGFLSPLHQALLCSGSFWEGCTLSNQKDSKEAQGKRYVCSQQGGVSVWEESS